jgi:transcriptional regulator of acetoin/glycerol metabolism
MSVLEDLQGLEKRVRDRMRELRPMLAEYQELERVAQRLGIDVDGEETGRQTNAEQQPARTRRASRTGRRVRPSGGRARAGSRREQMLSLIREQPGITVREAGERLGVDGTSLYRVVRRLEEEGAVKKEGTHLQPAA